MDCTIRVAKTKALISFAVTANLICAFFAYAKGQFSHDVAHMYINSVCKHTGMHFTHTFLFKETLIISNVKMNYLAFKAIFTLTTMVLNPLENNSCSVTLPPLRFLSLINAGSIKSIAEAKAA